MTREPDSPSATEAEKSSAYDMLRGKEYEHLTHMLHEADGACARSDDRRLIHIVDAAYRLFDTCQRYREEEQAHLEAYFSAHQRELDLLRELRAIIDVLLHAGSSSAPESVRCGHAAAEHASSELGTLGKTAAVSALHLSAKESTDAWRGDEAPLRSEDDAAEVEKKSDGNAAGHEGEEGPDTSRVETKTTAEPSVPTLDVYFLSPFQVFVDDCQITDWPNCKGKSIFKYLLANRRRPFPKEVLMDTFWPCAEANAARNNLNVAIYGLRKALAQSGNKFSFILFHNSSYLLNPVLHIWVDAEEFRQHRENALRLEQHGELEQAIQQYRAAEVLYQQPFLAEDRYEEWINPLRQSMEQDYVEILDRLAQYYFKKEDYDGCALVCRKVLGVDACNEAPHCLLMRCYSRLGQPHLALRQFHRGRGRDGSSRGAPHR